MTSDRCGQCDSLLIEGEPTCWNCGAKVADKPKESSSKGASAGSSGSSVNEVQSRGDANTTGLHDMGQRGAAGAHESERDPTPAVQRRHGGGEKKRTSVMALLLLNALIVMGAGAFYFFVAQGDSEEQGGTPAVSSQSSHEAVMAKPAVPADVQRPRLLPVPQPAMVVPASPEKLVVSVSTDMQGGSGAGDATGNIKRGDIVKAVSTIQKRVDACFAKHKLHGVIRMKVIVARTGKVAYVSILGEFKGTPLGRCVVGVVSKAVFPPTKRGVRSFTYPFKG